MKKWLLIDINGKKSCNQKISSQINLNYHKVIRIPIKKIATILLVLLVVATFVFRLVVAPTSGDAQAAQGSIEERKALEAQLTQLEKQIDDYDNKVQEYKKQGNTLKSEIKKYTDKIAKLNLQIKAITLTIQKLSKEINLTSEQITVTQGKIIDKKKIIGGILQSMYQNSNQDTITIFLTNHKISDFFNEMSRLTSVQDKLRSNVEELTGLNIKLFDQKENLALQKEDTMSLIQYQQGQKISIQQTKKEKDNLLKITKGKESEYKKILIDTQKTAVQIRSRLFELVGGGALKFEEAYQLAKFAEAKTGVRAALILAVLDRESALGKNVGKCRYDVNPYYSARASNKTAMNPTRDIPIFLEIVKELNMNPDTTLVSCPIPSDGSYGGAMGPAQFIPSTWIRFKDEIASITSNSPASPWNNMDAFIATALYLKGAGAAGGSIYAEKVAAAKYYAGSRWSSYLSSYGSRVVERAQQFQQDINTLNA